MKHLGAYSVQSDIRSFIFIFPTLVFFLSLILPYIILTFLIYMHICMTPKIIMEWEIVTKYHSIWKYTFSIDIIKASLFPSSEQEMFSFASAH